MSTRFHLFKSLAKYAVAISISITSYVAAYGCKCATFTFSQAVDNADRIFIGKAIDLTYTDHASYRFLVSRVFKGNKEDTIILRTAIGGPACGMTFDIGKSYLVYASNDSTTRCQRNQLEADNPDVPRLKFRFDKEFAMNIGKTNNPVLTTQEAEYFNSDLARHRGNFDFQNKKVAFVYNATISDKKRYFERNGITEVVNSLIILTESERQSAKGYDAVIVSWRKQGVSKRFRKRILQALRERDDSIGTS